MCVYVSEARVKYYIHVICKYMYSLEMRVYRGERGRKILNGAEIIRLVALGPGVGVGDVPDCSIRQLCKPPLACKLTPQPCLGGYGFGTSSKSPAPTKTGSVYQNMACLP